MSLPVKIWPVSVEMPTAVRLDQDLDHDAYDRAAVSRFWRALRSMARVLTETRCSFVGKASPVHFFWGGFDLAVTRFSGRPAPPREGPAFMREAYSKEVISHGFWPGRRTDRGGRVLRLRGARTEGPQGSAATTGGYATIMPASASSFCRTRRYGRRHLPRTRFAILWPAPTTPRRHWQSGTAQPSSASEVGVLCPFCGPFPD